MKYKAAYASIILLAVTACAESKPEQRPFTFVYSAPENIVTNTQVASTTPGSLGELSPAAGGNMRLPVGHENDPGAMQLRETQNRKAIRENRYESIGILRAFPSDY